MRFDVLWITLRYILGLHALEVLEWGLVKLKHGRWTDRSGRMMEGMEDRTMMVGDSRHRLPGLVSASRWEVVNLHQPAWLVQIERLPYCVFQGAIDG
jgi:hypothetical protein